MTKTYISGAKFTIHRADGSVETVVNIQHAHNGVIPSALFAKMASATPTPAPAPVAQPTLVQRAPAAEQPTLKLGQINERLGYVVTADLLGRLGFAAHSDRSAKLYREGDFKAICAALSTHTLAVGAEIAQAT